MESDLDEILRSTGMNIEAIGRMLQSAKRRDLEDLSLLRSALLCDSETLETVIRICAQRYVQYPT